MGAPGGGGGRPGADWTAAYILIGVGVPVGWAIAVAVAVISERRAARRPVDPRVTATIVALSDVRTFPWRVPADEEDVAVVASGSNSSSSTAAGSTYVNDDAAADPAAEELVEMQRAQNAWVSESESQSRQQQEQQQQYKSRADTHREKVWQQLGRQQQQDTGVWDSLTPGSSEPQQNQNRDHGHRRYHHQTREPARQHNASSSHDRRHEQQQGGRAGGGGGGGCYDSDTSSRYPADTAQPGRSAIHDSSPGFGPGPDAGPSRSLYRELTRAPQPPSPPPQPKSAFPATRRDWRPSGDGGTSRR